MKKTQQDQKLLQQNGNQPDTQRIFNFYDIHSCLFDMKRVEYLKEAIFQTVKPGDIVVDAGSGTGLLGMIAVLAGAAKVYCIEINEECITTIEENAKRNTMNDQIIPLPGDATSIALPEKVDVIISEVLSCGFFYEPQLQIISNLKKYLKKNGSIIPMQVNTYVELINAQELLYGLQFSYDTRYRALDEDKKLTTKAKYLTTNFYEETPFSIISNATVRALTNDKTNALRISYDIQFADAVIATEQAETLLIPQILFLNESKDIQKDAFYNITLAYEASSLPLTCKINIRKVK